MKKIIGLIAGLFLSTVLLAGGLYVFLMYYYRNTFPAFLWINDIYSTGKTIEEINEELLQKNPYYGIKVIDVSGAELLINSFDIDFRSDYTAQLRTIQESRGGINWWQSAYGEKHLTVDRTVSYDEEKLKNIIMNWEAFPDADYAEVSIIDTDDGYALKDTACHVPLLEDIVNAVIGSVYNLDKEIVLNERFYADFATPEQIHTRDLFAKIDDIQSREYFLDFNGEKIAIGKENLSKLLLTSEDYSAGNTEAEASDEEEKDKRSKKTSKSESEKNPGEGKYIADGMLISEEDISEEYFHEDNGFMVNAEGDPVISEAKLYDYSLYLSKNYDTEWFLERYLKGQGDVVFINEKKTGKGALIDSFEAFENLERMFANKDDTDSDENADDESSLDNVLSLIPGVKSYDASEKLGKTFIEINMDEQRLKYYVDSKLSMEMPVVTGNINRGRGTPAGIFDVYNKRYHTYLKGVGYVSYVNYWLGVHKGVGIHDANWRNKFGEEIYKSDGSHGCINCPEDKVSSLWEVVEIGTPVIMYY